MVEYKIISLIYTVIQFKNENRTLVYTKIFNTVLSKTTTTRFSCMHGDEVTSVRKNMNVSLIKSIYLTHGNSRSVMFPGTTFSARFVNRSVNVVLTSRVVSTKMVFKRKSKFWGAKKILNTKTVSYTAKLQ